MPNVYCSTGAFIGRPNGRDFRLIEKYAPLIDCDGFEFMFYDTWYGREREITDFLNGTGLKFPTYHCEKKIGEIIAEENFSEAYRKFEINCRTAAKIGSRLMVMHLWNGPISDSNISANYSAVPELIKIAESYGIELTFENVVSNGRSPLTLWRGLLERYPEALLTYDTKMSEFHRENAAAFEPENVGIWKNVRHLHINDRAGKYRDWSDIRSLHIGQGTVDFPAFFKHLGEVGYSGAFTVEASAFVKDVPDFGSRNRTDSAAGATPKLDLDAVNKSLGEVRKLADRG